MLSTIACQKLMIKIKRSCPCLTCTVKIAQVGISEVVYSQGYNMDQDVCFRFIVVLYSIELIHGLECCDTRGCWCASQAILSCKAPDILVLTHKANPGP